MEFPDQYGITIGAGATATVKDNTITYHIYWEEPYYPCSIVFNEANGEIEGNTISGSGIWLNTGWFTTDSWAVSIKDNTIDASELAGLSEVTTQEAIQMAMESERTPTGPRSADFVVAYKMGEAETTETGSAWWDGERKQLAIKEGDEIGYSNLTINGYESRAVLEDGILELGISEAVVSEESLTIHDDATQVMEWSAVNINGETLVNGKLTFKPVASKTATTLTAEVISAISMTITTTSVDFGKVGTGMTSRNQVITVVNTGADSTKVSSMLLDDNDGFYNESLRLNGLNISDFSCAVPSDTSDFWYEYEVVTKLVVPDWAGGKYDGTILFVAESES